MSSVLNRVLAKVLPFIGIGIFIVLFIVGLVLFSYLLLIGAAIGLILFAIGYVRAKLFGKKRRNPAANADKFDGRTIEQEEIEIIEYRKQASNDQDNTTSGDK